MTVLLTQKLRLTQGVKKALMAALFLASSQSFAYYSTLDTADLLKPGEYAVTAEPQYIFDNYPGANFTGRFDMGASESGNLRFLLGTGRITFQTGAFYKIVPIPDTESQPGIGVFGGVLYAYQNTTSILNFRIHPEISKRFKSVDAGVITPYASIPFGVAFASGNTTYPVQFAVGTKWLPPGLKHSNFFAEFGFELNKDSFSYISLGFSIPFSETDSFKID